MKEDARTKGKVGPQRSTALPIGSPPVSGVVGGPASENPTGAAISPGPGGAGTGSRAVPATVFAAMVDGFITGIAPEVSSLSPVLQRPATGQQIGTVRSDHVVAAPLIVTLLRNHPEFGKVGDIDLIERGVADLNAARRLGQQLRELASAVEDTGKLSFDAGWQRAAEGYSNASRQARRDKTMDQAVAPVRNALRKGPRTATSVRTAATAQHKAAAAVSRATKAQQRAATAASKAAAVHPASAHKAHGVTTTPVENPQGPSAGAGVNPQGPARG